MVTIGKTAATDAMSPCCVPVSGLVAGAPGRADSMAAASALATVASRARPVFHRAPDTGNPLDRQGLAPNVVSRVAGLMAAAGHQAARMPIALATDADANARTRDADAGMGATDGYRTRFVIRVAVHTVSKPVWMANPR